MAQGEILNLSMPTTSPVQNQELEQVEEANVAENEEPGVGTERILRERIAQLELEVKRLKEANEELSLQKSPTDGDIKGSKVSVNALKNCLDTTLDCQIMKHLESFWNHLAQQ